MTQEKSVIDLANERITIIEACNMLGMDVHDFSIASLKVWCPFGHLYHSDGGTTKAMRIYPATNSAWCFACNLYFTPVKLIAMDRGIPDQQAALDEGLALQALGHGQVLLAVAPGDQHRLRRQRGGDARQVGNGNLRALIFTGSRFFHGHGP